MSRVLPEHLRIALRWPSAERVMAGGGPEVDTCIHGENMALFCAECAAFFCSMHVDEIRALAGASSQAQGEQT